jgi:hypothetical protein
MGMMRNIDVSRTIGVSPATVKNWITYALSNKIHLDVTRVGERYYIEDNAENKDRMFKLKTRGMKFRSRVSKIEVKPESSFYDVFSKEQIIDIATSMSYHSYLPLKYSYTHLGVKWFYESIMDMLDAKAAFSKVLNELILYINQTVDRIILSGRKVNIIEVGHNFSTYALGDVCLKLNKAGLLNKFITVSLSTAMNDLREDYLKNKFFIDSSVTVQKYLLDFEVKSLKSILFEQQLNLDESEQPINLCFFLIGTLNNSREYVRSISNLSASLSNSRDLIVTDIDLADEQGKDLFPRENHDNVAISNRFYWLLRMLNLHKHIEIEKYYYNPITFERFKYYTINHNITFFYLKRFKYQELIDIFKNLNLRVENYNYLNADNSGFFVLSRKEYPYI